MVESPENLIEGFCYGKSQILQHSSFFNQESSLDFKQDEISKVFSETKST
jgi:hypothetical protein